MLIFVTTIGLCAIVASFFLHKSRKTLALYLCLAGIVAAAAGVGLGGSHENTSWGPRGSYVD